MSSAAPERLRHDARPPITAEIAPPSGAAERPRPQSSAAERPRRPSPPSPAVRQRPWVAPHLWHDPLAELGYPPTHPYVRRYWTAAIGPGAVADLLRLAVAAGRGRALPRPLHLGELARHDLVRVWEGRLLVRATIPPLPADHVGRLPPALREEHRRLRWQAAHRPAP